jgi:hypothetical protein
VQPDLPGLSLGQGKGFNGGGHRGNVAGFASSRSRRFRKKRALRKPSSGSPALGGRSSLS